MEILPVQIAYRGFDHEFTLNWIYECIRRAIAQGTVSRPVHNIGTNGQGIPIHFAVSLIEYWKVQHDRHIRVEVPRDLWEGIDGILGASTEQQNASYTGRPES